MPVAVANRPTDDLKDVVTLTCTADQPATWTWLTDMLVRSAGFPTELVDHLRVPRAVLAVRRVLDCEADTKRAEARLLAVLEQWAAAERECSNGKQPPAVQSIRRHVHAGRPVDETVAAAISLAAADWNRLLVALAQTRNEAQEIYRQERLLARHALREILTQAPLLEALCASNPETPRIVERYIRADVSDDRSDVRRVERTLITYLQRLCMKNETIGFFGPINYGVLAEHAQPVSYALAPEFIRARKAFLAFWAVEALASQIVQQAELHSCIPIRLHSGYTVTTGGRLLSAATQKDVALPEEAVRLCQLADGRRSAATVAELLGDRVRYEALADALVRKRLLTRTFTLPATDWDPLATLREQVTRLPADRPATAHWLGVLDRFDQLRQEYAAGGARVKEQALMAAEQLFREATGGEPRRLAGQMYADRTLLYEECLGDLSECRLGKPVQEVLHGELSAVLDWAAGHAEAVRQVLQQQAVTLFQALAPHGAPVPLGRFLAEAAEQLRLPDTDAMTAPLTALIRSRWSGVGECEVRLEPEDLAGLPLAAPGCGPWLVSPDILIAGSPEGLQRGDFRVILGEVHWGFQIFSNLMMFHPEIDAIKAEALTHLHELVPECNHLANAVVAQRAGKTFFLEFLPRSVVFSGTSSRTPSETIHWAELAVVPADGELRVVNRTTGERVIPYMGDPHSPVSWLLAPPVAAPPTVSLGSYTPRITMGRLVVQRQRWETQAHVWQSPANTGEFAAWLSIWRQKERLGLPDRVFLRLPGERKPLYIDFQVPFLVEVLLTAAKRHTTLHFTEMLPTPDDAWLVRPDGRYCAEFRTACVRHGEAKPEPAASRERFPARSEVTS